MNLAKTALVAGLAALLIGDAAGAGELKLSSVRIDLDDSRSNVALIVSNLGTDVSLVQLRLVAWSQSGGADSLTTTRQLIANPPMAEIQGGAQQVVRVGYVGKLQQKAEASYRLIVEEVPKKDHQQSQTIETYLKLSVPVFIAPLPGADDAAAPPEVSIVAGPEGVPSLAVHNTDLKHLRITGYQVADASGRAGKNHPGLFYVLPDATMLLPLDVADPHPPTAKTASFLTEVGSTPIRINLRP